MLAHGREDLAQHVVVESLGLDVVARTMVAIEQEDAVLQLMDGGMPEGGVAQGHGEKLHDGLVRDPSKGKDCAQLFHGAQLLLQPGSACGDFRAGWLVEGRDARNGVGDGAITKAQPVVGIFGVSAA